MEGIVSGWLMVLLALVVTAAVIWAGVIAGGIR